MIDERLFLPSSSSYTYFTKYTLSNFNVKLSKRLDINDSIEYEVGLCKLQFPNQIINIRNGRNKVGVY